MGVGTFRRLGRYDVPEVAEVTPAPEPTIVPEPEPEQAPEPEEEQN